MDTWYAWVTFQATPCGSSTPQLFRGQYRFRRMACGAVEQALVPNTLTQLTHNVVIGGTAAARREEGNVQYLPSTG